ncbi:MAG: hypothetical protein IJ058_15250 [Lachnospiraceae bacterium]|nr:hypothetical protein [Lachnospiraceae bacterium]MBQ8948137.1 hypothetical protein [Lachnospiraceae bacterium]
MTATEQSLIKPEANVNMDTAAKLTDEEIREAKSERLMETIAWRAAYYRANPQRFVKDFTKVELRPFQQILI